LVVACRAVNVPATPWLHGREIELTNHAVVAIVAAMRRVVLRPFEPGDLAGAARLLAARHAAHRVHQPLLPQRYEDPAAAADELAEVWACDGASGAVALADDRVTGFLLGAPKAAAPWGPNLWVEAAGQALADAETVRDLYGLAATRWVAEGRTAHYVLVPASDRALLDAWFRLGFGLQQVHAVRPTRTGYHPPAGLTIRRAVRDDVDVLAELEIVLPAHQRSSPVFSSAPVPAYDQARAEWEQDFDDEDFTTFVAERDGRVVGSAAGCSLSVSSVHRGPARPDPAAFFAFAAVQPQARGTGVGRALGEAVIDWAANAGYDRIVTDWRSTNLLSSRAWPRLGYAETFLRLHRLIGY
jgi:GNAT superfamily N-acetyltransferase